MHEFILLELLKIERELTARVERRIKERQLGLAFLDLEVVATEREKHDA